MPAPRASRAKSKAPSGEKLSLEQLRPIISDASGSRSEVEYSHVISSLFRLLKSERGARLAECLRYLGANVEALQDKKSRTTAINIILDGLLGEDPFLQPLCIDYTKALKSLLDYAPHAEHLPTEQWAEVANLCQQGIAKYCESLRTTGSDELAVRNGSGRSFTTASRSGTPASTGWSASVARKATAPTPRAGADAAMLDDLLVSLSHLFSVPHAPILDDARSALEVIFEFLGLTRSLSNVEGQRAAFVCVTSILSVALTEDVDLCLWIVKCVVPHIRRLFPAKSNQALRDQMLIIMLYSQSFLTRWESGSGDEETISELRKLAETLRFEYSTRPTRFLLRLDDLLFSTHDALGPLRYNAVRFRTDEGRVEQTWAQLRTIAVFADIGATRTDVAPSAKLEDEDEDLPSKRRRIEQPTLLRAVLSGVASAEDSEVLAALHILMLFSLESRLQIENRHKALDVVVPLISNENSDVADWAMVVVACLASYGSGIECHAHGDLWLKAWQSAAHVSSKSAGSRAACHAMAALLETGVVSFPDISKIVDAMISSIDLNGPAILADSAVRLWVVILRMRARHRPSLVQETSSKALQWLFAHWRPAELLERIGDPPASPSFEALDLLALVGSVLGIPTLLSSTCVDQSAGLIGQAQTRLARSDSLVKYLADARVVDQNRPHDDGRRDVSDLSSSQQRALSRMVLEAVLEAIRNVLRSDAFTLNRTSFQTSGLALQSLSALAILAFSFMSTLEPRKTQDLQNLTSELCQRLRDLLLRQERMFDSREVMACTIAPLLPSVTTRVHSMDMGARGSILVAREIGSELWSLSAASRRSDWNDMDLMDFEVAGDSQVSHQQLRVTEHTMSRDWLGFEVDPMAVRLRMLWRVYLYSLTSHDLGASSRAIETIPADFIRSMENFPSSQFIACRSLILEVLSSDAGLDPSFATAMLGFLGAKIFTPYDYSRSEAGLGIAIDILGATIRLWPSAEGKLVTLSKQLYGWFITAPLQRNNSSPHVLIGIGMMLKRVVDVDPEIIKASSLPSARTCLFRILMEGTAAVKFAIGSSLSNVFGRFLLKEHDQILDDVLESLPLDPSWLEGSAVRLFILSTLGAAWPTLIRRAIYSIVEATTWVPGVIDHARAILGQLSNRRALQNSRELLRLFAPQILYTWLQTHSLQSIPFSVFDYQSLPSLLEEVRDEIIAQVIMRGRDAEAQDVSELLGLPFTTLLEQSFAKCAAYCIARDAAIDPAVDQIASAAAKRLRTSLGKDQYLGLLAREFPEILAALFTSLDREDSIVKSFQKHEKYSAAQTALEEILSSGSSSGQLAVSQQPSFRSTCLLDEIEYLCSRAEFDADNIWTPALYTYVFRRIANTIHPALGELHTCSAIRRLRILISMAGDVALTGYPLEMALHFFENHLGLAQCAEDLMSIFRYLFTRGWASLEATPSFVAGTLVSTLTSARSFLEIPQSSTTQESDFRNMMTRAKEFHGWVVSAARDYNSPHMGPEQDAVFRKITTAAGQLRGAGTAATDAPESELILAVLDDAQADRSLIGPSTRNRIISHLSASFKVPPTHREDMLSSSPSSEYTRALWMAYANGSTSGSFGLWVGRVLGRAYAQSGHIDPSFLRETSALDTHDFGVPSTDRPMAASRAVLVHSLCDYLHAVNQSHVGLAEAAIRQIVNAADADPELKESLDELPASISDTLIWKPYQAPALAPPSKTVRKTTPSLPDVDGCNSHRSWIQHLCEYLLSNYQGDAILSALLPIAAELPDLSWNLFPCILHLTLLVDYDYGRLKKVLSKQVNDIFRSSSSTVALRKRLIEVILYLWTQPRPREATRADRCHWLEIDFRLAADVAVSCNMFKTALMFLEIDFSEQSQIKRSRRSSGIAYDVPTDVLRRIFQNLNDNDWIYGLPHPPSLPAVMSHLQYEDSSFKRLSFQSAYLDSKIRYLGTPDVQTEVAVADVLNQLELSGLCKALLTSINGPEASTSEVMFHTARKLETWDLSSQTETEGQPTTIFKVFQGVHDKSDPHLVRTIFDGAFQSTLCRLKSGNSTLNGMHKLFETFAVLSEAEEVLTVRDATQLEATLSDFDSRNRWMSEQRPDFVSAIDSSRRSLLSTVSKNPNLRAMMNISSKDARAAEVRMLLASSVLSRRHGALQGPLGSAMYLTQLIEPCYELGFNFDIAIRSETANVLWDQGEPSSSINMLQAIVRTSDFRSQSIPIGKAEILGQLGHRVSEARREKPEDIMQNYLVPAIGELKGKAEGPEAGRVFHQFAVFCDQQLQNPDSLEDFRRVETLRQRKEDEVRDLKRMIDSSGNSRRDLEQLKIMKSKAQKWLELDNLEFRKLKENRTALLCQSLENYLLCLRSCDIFDNDALRFSALWLEHFESPEANAAVAEQISRVASRKFASLMNQWTSRLLDANTDFQKLLAALVLRVCTDHPYHGMYHIFSSSKSKSANDPTARSRQDAASKIASKLKQSKRTGNIWLAVHNSNVNYVRFAMEPMGEGRVKQWTRLPLRKSASGLKLWQDAQTHRVPPPTMTISLRPSCDYASVPFIQSYHNDFTVATGISAPKILTAVTSDGRKHKQLFKSGNDDLRQDAIMEQVFEHVNSLLKAHPQARQRNIKIRTYKVLPLTTQSGVIEFVANTTALHDYLMPAHKAYFPSDLSSSSCRKAIVEAQDKKIDERIRVFRDICGKFHPVLRYFFMEKFANPDDWFEKRLAYTRSTAAVSILGHVLGLGDRHGHNILLDDQTGEVVHIDLGIAFEQGRVLPVPELVPFRLTRDVIDGMGITKTEGVFRRCCEFTLDALRQESDTIMTILDVLRYDPLYNWSVSPLRLRKFQEYQMKQRPPDDISEDVKGSERSERKEEEGEADRALTVVTKKLSKSLSVEAAVSELIQQAMDEKNLALLFAGWAAYA